jgi:hypothetical protein
MQIHSGRVPRSKLCPQNLPLPRYMAERGLLRIQGELP